MILTKVVEQVTSPPHCVYTQYDLSTIIFHAWVANKKSFPKPKNIERAIDALISDEVIAEKAYPGGTIYTVSGAEAPNEYEVVCATDMFCYVSHWSAMFCHQLEGVKASDALYITNPEPKLWRKYAKERVALDFSQYLEEYFEGDFKRPQKISPHKIGKLQVINTYTSQYDGAFQTEGEHRISTIGRTFLDMLRCPSRCGGIHQVIEVYKRNASKYIDDIVNCVSKHGNKIETVRAGYLLDEICGLQHEAITQWLKNAQRGGSRKLDPNNDYAPVFSERWCLSINT